MAATLLRTGLEEKNELALQNRLREQGLKETQSQLVATFYRCCSLW